MVGCCVWDKGTRIGDRMDTDTLTNLKLLVGADPDTDTFVDLFLNLVGVARK